MALRKLLVLVLFAALAIACGDTRVEEEKQHDATKDKSERIALLIHDLENVQATVMITPGYVMFGPTPEVQALAREGEDAVDPLIFCLENDPRMTRTVDQSSITGKSRTVGVEEPAFAALQIILHCHDQFPWLAEPYSNYGPGGERLDRKALAVKIREYWNKYRGMSEPERWYAILRDDKATPEAWEEAAGNIVLPDNQDLFGGYGVMMMNRPHKLGAPDVFWGEVLRGKTAPSVSELLVRRLQETQAKQDPKSPWPLEPPERLAKALAEWDGKNQLESLRWHCGELQKIIARQGDNNGTGQIDDLILTYLERIENGDTQVMREYANWIRSADAVKLHKLAHDYGATFFSPLWSYPKDPVMNETANWLFQDAHSPWSLGPADPDPTWIVHSARIPLVGLPVFRALVLKQLKETRVIGKTEVTHSDQVLMSFNTGAGSGWNVIDAPPAGTKIDLRFCDAIAFSISKIRGAPECEPYWSIDRRDRGVKEAALFLGRYGDRLLRKSISGERDDPFIADELLTFSPLDHPATQADLTAGLAIFSMEGQGERKVVALPTVPLHGKWKKLKIYPQVGVGTNPLTGISGVMSAGYDQEGTIWQAEDVFVAGKWQRYYGFLGKNCLAAVPADEIQLDN